MSDPQQPDRPIRPQPDVTAPGSDLVRPPAGPPDLPGNEEPGGSIAPTTPADVPAPADPLGVPPTEPQEVPTQTPAFPQPQR